MIKKKKCIEPIIESSKYLTFKNNINNFCKKSTILMLENLCNRTNIIVHHSYYFIRYYYAWLFEQKLEFPTIDHKMIRDIFTFVSTKTRKEQNKVYESSMEEFNNEIFSKLNLCPVSRNNITQSLTYETERIIVNMETNIKEHFKDHYDKYIKIEFNLYEKINNIKKNNTKETTRINIKQLYKDYNEIKFNIVDIHEPIIVEHYNFILYQRQKLFSHINEINENVLYDVKCNPLQYLRTFYIIVDTYEKRNIVYNMNESIKFSNSEIKEKNILITALNEKNDYQLPSLVPFTETISYDKKIKLFNVTPLQTTLIPKYFTIDSESIIQNFKELIKKNIYFFSDSRITNVETLRRNFNNEKTKSELWSIVFNMKHKFFKKRGNYKFNYTLTTDCFSCAGLFYHQDMKTIKKGRTKSIKSKFNNDPQYIESVIANSNLDLTKQIVCIDPNKRDLIYCGTYEDNNENNKLKLFRYTSCQRRKEMKTKLYNKRKYDPYIKKLESKKIIDKRSINTNALKKYIINCNKIDTILRPLYMKDIYRKLKWYSYLNQKKSENKMIKNFEKQMGHRKNTIVTIGDYSCKSSNMCGTLPAIAKSIIKIFKSAQYETYIISEVNTSKLCNHCGGEMETFLQRKSPKPPNKNNLNNKNFDANKLYPVHGLLRCKSVEHNCQVIHNRDTNAVLNMLKIVRLTKETLTRPLQYCHPIRNIL